MNDSFLAAPGTQLAARASEAAAKSASKQQQLGVVPPAPMAAEARQRAQDSLRFAAAGNAQLLDNARQTILDAQVRAAPRTGGEALTDAALAIPSGIAKMAQAGSGLLDVVDSVPGLYADYLDTVNAEERPPHPLYGDTRSQRETVAELLRNAPRLSGRNRATDAFTNLVTDGKGATAALGGIAEDINDYKSDNLQARQDLVNRDLALRAEDLKYARDAAIAAGEGAVGANAAYLADSFGAGVSSVFEDGAVASDLIIEQLPQLAVGPAAKAATGGRAALQAIQQTALNRALSESLEGALTGTVRSRADELAEPALASLRSAQARNLAGIVGGMEAGGAAADTAESISSMPIETLRKQPEFQRLIEITGSEDEARARMARQGQAVAAGITAPIAAAAGAALSRFELGAAPGARAVGLNSAGIAALRNTAAGMPGEVVEESIQGAVSEIAGNTASNLAGATDGNVLDGAGVASGQGAAIAGGLTGSLGGTATALGVAKDTGRVGAAVGGKVLNVAAQRVEKARTAPQAAQTQAVAEQAQRVVQAAPSIMETAAAVGKAATAVTNLVSNTVSNALEARVVAQNEELASSVDNNVVSLLSGYNMVQKVESLLNNAEVPAADRAQILTTGVLRVGQMQQAMMELDQLAAENLTLEQREDIEDARTALNSTLESPTIKRVMAKFEAMGQEEVSSLVSLVQSSNPEEVAQGMAALEALAQFTPEKIDSQTAKIALAQSGLDSVRRAQYERIAQAAQVMEQNTANQEELARRVLEAGELGNGVSPRSQEQVREMIRKGGWDAKRGSLESYNRDIQRALANDDLDTAQSELERLRRWAENQIERVNLFDRYALQAESTMQSTKAVGTRTLNSDGSKTVDKARVLYPYNARSMSVVFATHNDAVAMVELYNSLNSAMPNPAAELNVPDLKYTGASAFRTPITPRSAQGEAASASAPNTPKETGLEDFTDDDLQDRHNSVLQSIKRNGRTEQNTAALTNVRREMQRRGLRPNQENYQEPAGESETGEEASQTPQAAVATESPVEGASAVDGNSPSTKRVSVRDLSDDALASAINAVVQNVDAKGELSDTDSARYNVLAAEQARRNVTGSQPITREVGARKTPTTVVPATREATKTTTKGDKPASAAATNRVLVDEAVEAGAPMVKYKGRDYVQVGEEVYGVKSAKPIKDQAILGMFQEEAAEVEVEVAEDSAVDESPAERFSTLADGPVPENATSRQRLGARNYLKSGFNKTNAQTPVTKFGADAISQVVKALSAGMSEVTKVFGSKELIESSAGRTFARSLASMAVTFDKKLNDRLNANQSVAKLLKRWHAGTMDYAPWAEAGKLALQATNAHTPNTQLAYDPEVMQGLVLGAMQWVIENGDRPVKAAPKRVARILGVQEHEVNSSMLAPFNRGVLESELVTALAKVIADQLGITAKAGTPVDQADGIPKALSAEVLDLMTELKYFEVERSIPTFSEDGLTGLEPYSEAKHGKGDVYYKTYRIPDTSPVKLLAKAVSGSRRGLHKMLNPEFQSRSWSIGAPVSNGNKNIRGSKQMLSAKQLKALDSHNKTPFYYNKAFADHIMEMGREKFLSLVGYVNLEQNTEINVMDKEQVEGKNRNLETAWEALEQLQAELSNMAEQTGQDITTIPVHFDWYITSNGRIMMEGLGPQADKLLREILSPTKVTMQLDNPGHVRDLRLAVAQALGIKTETQSHEAIMAELDKLFDDENGKLANAMELLVSGASPADISYELADAGIDSVRGVNAMVTYANYLNASQSEESNDFDVFLSFELDGKTDGPANAIGQFGLWGDIAGALDMLAMGGYFFNSEFNTLNDAIQQRKEDGKPIDLYESVSRLIREAVNSMLDSVGSDRDGARINAQMKLVEFLQIDPELINDDLTKWSDKLFTRGLAKQPVTASGYAGTRSAIANGLVGEIKSKLGKELTKRYHSGDVLPKGVVDAVAALTGVRIPNDPKKYLTVKLDERHTKKLSKTFKNKDTGVGAAIYNAITEQMGDTVDTMNDVVSVTQLQFHALAHEYQSRYQARHAELVADGKIHERNALPRNEEEALLAELSKLSPILQLAATTDEFSRNFGLNILERSNQGQMTLNGQLIRATSLSGTVRANINVRRVEDPRVRAAALFNIANGDSNMMLEMFQQMHGHLNVWDGLEVGIGQIDSASEMVNKAVYDSHSFDALGAVLDNLAQSQEWLEDIYAKNPRLRAETMEAMQLEVGPISFMKELRATLERKHRRTRAVKKVLAKYAHSIDHMAGARKPYLGGKGTVSESQLIAEIVAENAAMAASEQAAVPGNVTEASKKALSQDLSISRDEALAILSKQPLSKVQKYVLSTLSKFIPNELNVYTNSAKEAYERATGEFFPNKTNAMYFDGSIYLATPSFESLVHELTHAALDEVLNRAFNMNGQGINDGQREAARNLSLLAKAFVELDTASLPAAMYDAMALAQRTVATHVANNDPYSATQELLAWMTNPAVTQAMQLYKVPNTLKSLVSRVVEGIRKLLGLSSNADDFLTVALNEMTFLADNKSDPRNDNDPKGRSRKSAPLAQSNLFGGASSPSNSTLGNVVSLYQSVLERTNKADPVTEKLRETAAAADLAKLLNAGFVMDSEQQLAFQLMHQAMTSSHNANPRAMTAAQALVTQVVDTLKPSDLMADKESNAPADIQKAQEMFDALLSTQSVVNKTSTLLPKVVAMAVVNPEFGAVLDTMALAKPEEFSGTWSNRFEQAANKVMDAAGNFQVLDKKSTHTVSQAMQVLADKLFYAQEYRRTPNFTDAANDAVVSRMSALGKSARERAEAMARNQQSNARSTANKVVELALRSVSAMLDKDEARNFGEVALSLSNSDNTPDWVRNLVTELVGTTDLNAAINLMLNKTKFAVSHIRQRLREELPGVLDAQFVDKLTKEQRALTHLTIGRTDMQSLLADHSVSDIAKYLETPAALSAAKSAIVSKLRGDKASIQAHAKDLARVMTGKGDHSVTLLRRNAAAIFMDGKMSTEVLNTPTAAKQIALIDQLITLEALELLDSTERAQTATILADPGAEKLLRYLEDLSKREAVKSKSTAARLNAWKGNLPIAADSRHRVILATAAEKGELEQRGYTMLDRFQNNPYDKVDLYYYRTTSGNMSTFNQGAFQTAELTVMGASAVTGHTVDGRTYGHIRTRKQVNQITASLVQGNSTGSGLAPVFNSRGEVVGYERMIPTAMQTAHTKTSADLFAAVGMWEGRLHEELLAAEMNKQVADKVHDSWLDGKRMNREAEYVDVSKSTDPIIADSWAAIPEATKTYLKELFGDEPIMVRKDMANNVLGYRNPSVRDLFTTDGKLDRKVKEHLRVAAIGFFGKSAFKYMSAAEGVMQSAVSTAKDIIVVRSLVVGVVNLVSNQLQALSHGISPVHLAKIQARTVSELRVYQGYEKELGQLNAKRSMSRDQDEIARLTRQMTAIEDAKRRMEIWPLIEAGELPAIAEDLTVQDEFNLLSDATKWMEEKIGKLPPGVRTGLNWLTISKETPLYKGMNRMIQYGDFMGKMAVYDHLTNTKGIDPLEARKLVSEEFVNYNFLPGRTRTYLESIGMTWFMNYKMRIQKILLRHLRDNPLRALAYSAGGAAVGLEHLYVSLPWEINYGYALGPIDPITNAPDAILWNQIVN